MTTKTETYVLGMQSINHFYSMLHAAMREVMPDAEFSQTGAFVWMGYQIDSYKELARGLYCCQIYPGNPRELLFQEGYFDDKRKASEFEKKQGIMQGRYHYPFSDGVDLIRTRFFDFNKEEQFDFSKSFVSGAVERALIWQKSEARKKVTSAKFLEGNSPRPIPVLMEKTYEKVGMDFLQAWEFQNSLLGTLQGVLSLFPGKEWVRPNASIYNFGCRGMRLKFSASAETTRWSIFFADADRLKFEIPNKRKNSYNLIEHNYFDLPADEQKKELTNFAQASLGMTI